MAVEIGTYAGKSSIAIGLGLQGGRLYTVDHFRGNPEHRDPPARDVAWHHLKAFGLLNVATILEGESVIVAETFRQPVDMLYVDGCHEFQAVIDDFAAWWPHVTAGGHILFHDAYLSDWPGVAAAVSAIADRWPLVEMGPAGSIRHFRKRINGSTQ